MSAWNLNTIFMSAFSVIKKFLLTHEPFKPAHMGTWIRGFYFRHYIQKYVPLASIQNALDGACGNGQYAQLIATQAPQARVKAVDLIEGKHWSEFAMPNITFSKMDLCALSEKNEEDLIVSIDTIEHIVHNENVLQKFFEALLPGGILYLAVPCEGDNWRFFPRSWFKRFHEWEEHEHIGEQRTIEELAALLHQMGFKILLARNTFTFWGTLVWEIERLLSWGGRSSQMLNVLLMPLYKLFGLLDIYIPIGKGDNLVIAQKSG